jgi:pilus assembly protein CpaB
MGKLKAVVPLVLAIVVALVTSLLIYRWMQSKTVAPAPSVVTEEKGNVALAATDLAWRTKLTAEMIKMVSFPRQALSAGNFSDPKALEGRVLVAQVKQNEPILESKLAPTSITTGGVAAVVTPGKRALAVAGDKVIGLAGFIQPGNRVDVLGTLKNPANDKDYITKVVLEDVLVLATGTQIQNAADGKPAPVDVFTLEVSPEEGERLSLAATQGKLHFALRNVTDKDVVNTMGSTVADALDAYRPRMKLVKDPVVAPTAAVNETSRRSFEVQTIRGNKVSKQTF